MANKILFSVLILLVICFGCKKDNPTEVVHNNPPAAAVSQDLVPVTGSTFTMGSNNTNYGANPPHSVTVSSFYIDKYEIMYWKWKEVCNWGLSHGYIDLPTGQNGYTPSVYGLSDTNNPVTRINWCDIVKWCNARSEKDGLMPVYYTDSTQATVYHIGQIDLAANAVKWTSDGYRLPTEAEWEFAARGGISTQGYIYSGSNTIDSVAWYSSNSGMTTHTVGTKAPNELGIYDMSGNAMEWCWDWFAQYSNIAQTDPKGPIRGSYRVLRGGVFDGNVIWCHIVVRGLVDSSNYRNNEIGFRCVKD